MEWRQPRWIASIGLLALVPVVAFVLGRADTVAAVSAVNVVIIAASFYYMIAGEESAEPVAA